MKTLTYAALSLTIGLFYSASAAADAAAMAKTCDGCHGDNGISQWTDVPTIAGIDSFVHSDALFVYRDNERPCAKSDFRQGDTSRAATTMCEVVADMSDEEIEDIADFYAGLPFQPALQEFDATLAAAGADIHKAECDRCHSDGGSNVEDEASILSGQWMGYMEQTFADYASGARPQDGSMQEKMDPLSDEDVKALIHYYASQQ